MQHEHEIDQAALQDLDSSLRKIPGLDVRRSGRTWTLRPHGGKVKKTIVVAPERQWIVIKHALRARRRLAFNRKNARAIADKLHKMGAIFSGLLKGVIDREGYPELRADIPFVDSAHVESRVYEVINDLLSYSKMGPRFHGAVDTPPRIFPGAHAMCDILDQCGWPYRKINDSRFSFDLETDSHYQSSILEVSPNGCTTLEAILYKNKGERPPEQQLRALSSYLLYANTHTRLVRFNTSSKNPLAVAARVVFPGVPIPLEVAAGLRALSTAASRSGQSIPLLMDDFVAREYLSAQYSAV